MRQAMQVIYRCVDENLPLNVTTLQQLLDEKTFSAVQQSQAFNHDQRLQRQDIDMYLDRLQSAKPVAEQVKTMDDAAFTNFFADLGKKKGARPAETEE